MFTCVNFVAATITDAATYLYAFNIVIPQLHIPLHPHVTKLITASGAGGFKYITGEKLHAAGSKFQQHSAGDWRHEWLSPAYLQITHPNSLFLICVDFICHHATWLGVGTSLTSHGTSPKNFCDSMGLTFQPQFLQMENPPFWTW